MADEALDEIDEESIDETALASALYRQCRSMWEVMDKESHQVTEGRIWQGFTSTMLKEQCGISAANYTAVTRCMQAMGCIQQLRRGGGPSPSVWLLRAEPTLARFRNYESRAGLSTVSKGRLNKVNKEQLLQHITDLNRRVTALEDEARRQGWAT